MGGGMDGMPFFNQVPGRGWQFQGFPWGGQGPLQAEGVDPLVEPYARDGNVRAGQHAGNRSSTQQNSSRAAPSPRPAGKTRRIIVTDGSEERKEQAKPNSQSPLRGNESQVKEEKQQQAWRKPRFESQEDAARCIQRRFRGYQVRRTHPLKQLRVIKDVRDKLKAFQEVACRPDFVQKARDDRMEQLRFEESIMKELLKLDSLQGVHPLVRDIRKATARDLLRLQDKTDEALASGVPINFDDLKHVETPLDSGNEDEEDMCPGIEEVTVGAEAVPSGLETAAVAQGVDASLVESEVPPSPFEEISGRDVMDDEGEAAPRGASFSHGSGTMEEEDSLPSAGRHHAFQYLGTSAADSEMEFPGVICGDVSPSVAAAIPGTAGAEAAQPDVLSSCRDDYFAAGERDSTGAAAEERADEVRKSNPGTSQEKTSKVEILQLLRKENQQLREMVESVLKLQALSISNLCDRVGRLEEQQSKGSKLKHASTGRKARSRHRRDLEDA